MLTELGDIVGMHSYFLSPIVIAFFVGPQWDSAVKIHVHAGKMKNDWSVHNVKHFSATIYQCIYNY